MKKLLVVSLLSIIMLTGCGATETLSCSYKTDYNNGSAKINYDIDHERNEIKKIRITYNYDFNDNTSNNENSRTIINDNNNVTDDTTAGENYSRANENQIDGVGTGTDGTTNDTQIDNDGIVDGVVGSVIDTIVGGVTGIILDAAGLRDRHAMVQNTYGNINGFSVQNTDDTNNNYSVTYVIDYDSISDDDLKSFNLSKSLDELRNNYVNQGFTCK